MVLVDKLTKAAHFIPIKSTINGGILYLFGNDRRDKDLIRN
jgi:hypothetical protein